MLQSLTGWHALLILAIVVLLFGAAKLPALARSVGQSVRILKHENKDTAASRAESDVARDELAARATATPVTTAVPMPAVSVPTASVPPAWRSEGSGDAEATGDTEAGRTTEAATEWDPAVLAEASRVRPGQRYLVTGSSAHPSRILIDSLPEGDPRRAAARTVPAVSASVAPATSAPLEGASDRFMADVEARP